MLSDLWNDQIMQKIGHLHPALVHFPIALALMTGVAELLYSWRRNPLYDHAAKFMLVVAAIMVVPTVITGWFFSEGATFSPQMEPYFLAHRALGMITGVWMIATAIMRFKAPRGPYLVALVVLVALVATTAALGGILVYGQLL